MIETRRLKNVVIFIQIAKKENLKLASYIQDGRINLLVLLETNSKDIRQM